LTGPIPIRAASSADLAAIASLEAASPEAAHWDPASYLEHRCTVAVLNDSGVAGFLVTRQTAPGECEILNIAVDPAQRRRGLARALIEEAVRTTPGAWFLEVRASNAPAIALYRRFGFEVVGRRPGYYSNPSETGIVMRFFS
jgi:[ribosomal protein S18]-alanine N-acetyltransferase